MEKNFNEIRFTPSSFDLQPWHFLLLVQAKIKKLQKYMIGNLQQTQNSSAIVLLCGNIQKSKNPNIFMKIN
uniref:Nitroreductase family protein n=1 Tax=Candidatus Phytoplasma australasiaticum subsp. australasiaticum TaxID=2832407 RepID=A0A7S7JMD7_9MOLU|nr:nitroreductase family protein ['Parthenium hysterophorus' phyllody phytoplasma]